MKWLGYAVLLIVLVFGLQIVASESGEVVVLTTTDETGAAQTTRLWVTDHDGSAWLRAGAEQQGWFQRLLKNPQIRVERAGVAAEYRASPEVAARDAINGLMAEKYGWADALIGMMFGRDDSVPIRLIPTSEATNESAAL